MRHFTSILKGVAIAAVLLAPLQATARQLGQNWPDSPDLEAAKNRAKLGTNWPNSTDAQAMQGLNTGVPLGNDVAQGIKVSVIPITRSVVAQQLAPGFSAIGLSNGTDTAQMSRVARVNMSGQTLTNIQFCYPGWYRNSTAEAALPNNYNVDTVTIEYPAGTFTPVTFAAGSSASAAIVAGSTQTCTDDIVLPLASQVPAGAMFWEWPRVSVASGGKWPFTQSIPTVGTRTTLGLKVERGVAGSLTNEVPNTAMAAGTGAFFEASVVRSTQPNLKGVFGAFGDSIVSINDAYGDTNGNITWVGRAASIVGVPEMQAGSAGTTAGQQASSGTTYTPSFMAFTVAWLQAGGVGAVLSEFGTNDLGAGDTLAVTKTVTQNVYHALHDGGFGAIYAMTLLPRTDVAGSTATTFQTTAAQAANPSPTGAYTGGTSSFRSQWNAGLRSMSYPFLTGYIEMANSVETDGTGNLAQDGGLWIATNQTGTPYLTPTGADAGATLDGVHMNLSATNPLVHGGIFIMRDAFVPQLSALMATVH